MYFKFLRKIERTFKHKDEPLHFEPRIDEPYPEHDEETDEEIWARYEAKELNQEEREIYQTVLARPHSSNYRADLLEEMIVYTGGVTTILMDMHRILKRIR